MRTRPEVPSIDYVLLTGRHGKICQFAGRCRHGLGRHWLLAIVVGCATALRAVVQLAYQPALIFPDSERYLQYAWQFINGHWSPDWLRTSGYSLLLIPAVLTRNLAAVAAVQHLLGLATAGLIYAALIHFGARRWLAALATVPVLADPLQLDIEQYVLTDVSATFLLVAALVVLVWKREASSTRTSRPGKEKTRWPRSVPRPAAARTSSPRWPVS